jgi:hypothetical protein
MTLAHSNEFSSAMSIPQEIVLNVPSYDNASAQPHGSTVTSSTLGKPKFLNPKALKEMSYHIGKVTLCLKMSLTPIKSSSTK